MKIIKVIKILNCGRGHSYVAIFDAADKCGKCGCNYSHNECYNHNHSCQLLFKTIDVYVIIIVIVAINHLKTPKLLLISDVYVPNVNSLTLSLCRPLLSWWVPSFLYLRDVGSHLSTRVWHSQ